MSDTLAPPAATDTPGSSIDRARAAGYSDDEINGFLAQKMTAARAAGYSQEEINAHLGIATPPPFDDAAEARRITDNFGPSAKPVTSLTDALEAGWQMSTAGLLARGAPPSKVVSEDAPRYARIAGQVTQMAGDVPAMVAGFAIGGGLGVETGPGAVVTGTAGALALPTALRETLMDAYTKGQFANFSDFWDRASGIMINTAKSWVTGAATGAVGPVLGTAAPAIERMAPALASPAVMASAKTAGEIATMTTVGAALEGNVPKAQDFLDAAVLLGGLKFAEAGAGKLRAIYAKTGIPPAAVVADAGHDVAVQQDLLSDKPIPDLYAPHSAEPIGEEEVGRAAAAGDVAEASSQPREASAPEPTEQGTPGATAYAAQPAEPKRLIQFLRESYTTGSDIHAETIPGGLQDVGGDVAASIGGPKGRPGLINNATGQPLDAATQRAWDAGYFPQHDQRPEINDLLDAIREDHTGNAQYSMHDQDRVAAYQGAQAQNSEIERIASQTGIDPKGKTRDQFFDAVTEHLSAEDAAVAQKASDDVHQEAFDKALASSKSDGADYGTTQSRSLAELEDEYRQEDDAWTAGHGAADDARSGPVTPDAGAGQAGGGLGGGVARDAGRDGAQAGAGGGGGPPDTVAGNLPAPAGPTGPPATLDAAKNLILSHISIGEAPPTRPWTFARVYTDIVNKLFPIEQAVTRTVGRDVLAAGDDAGKLARLMSGATGIADRFLRYNTLDFATRQPNGPGLEAILSPMRDDMDGFRAYAAAQRALELEGRDIPTGFDLDAARMVATEGAERYAQPLADLIAFQDRVSTYLRDAGVLSRAGYEAMREANRLYVPFQRVMDADGGTSIRPSGSSMQASNPIKGIKGSVREVIDPIESIIRNTYLFTQMAERNVVGTKLVDMLTAASEAEHGLEATLGPLGRAAMQAEGISHPDDLEPLLVAGAPVREGEIRILRDGRAETYAVDPELATAMKGLDSQTMGDLERMLRPFANSLRAGAVLQPDFVARHTIRDFLYAVVTHPGFFSPLDLVRGFTSLAVKDADYQDWLSSGGASVSMVSLDRRYLQHSIDQLAGTGIIERAWNVVGNPDASVGQKLGATARVPLDAARKFVLSPMQMAVEFAESATHIGTFIKAKNEMLAGQPEGTPLSKPQIQEAGFASRDIAVDASRMGAKIRTLNALSAFSNIAIQDTDRVMRAFVKSPVGTALKIAGAIALPSALVWQNGHDDPRYDDAPGWERDLFWVIPTDRWQDAKPQDAAGRPDQLVRTIDGQLQVNNGITFRVPKPWGMGLIFGSGVERSLDAFASAKPDAFKDFAKSMAAVSIPSLIPNAITPIIEQFANRSTFTNRTLVPDQMEKYLPEYQYTPYTTETSKALGQIMGSFPGIKNEKAEPGMLGGVARALSSPILLENYLRAWTGNLGMYALQLADKGLRTAGALPDPVKPDDTLADIPFVKAFVVRYPSSSVQSIQDFSDSYTRNKTYFDTWTAMAKDGNAEAMSRIQEAGGPMMMVQLNSIHTALAEHSQIIRDVYKNPDIPPDEKRQLIDTTYWRMSELAKIGNETLARARDSVAVAPGAPALPPAPTE